MKFCFGDIVVVENNLIGVVVKSFDKGYRIVSNDSRLQIIPPHQEVYVRMYNGIKEYNEDEMKRYMVRHKLLDEQELEWNDNANNG